MPQLRLRREYPRLTFPFGVDDNPGVPSVPSGNVGDVPPTPTTWTPDGVPRGAGAAPALGRPRFNFGPAPDYVPPNFVAPTLDDARNEPGFQMRVRAGSDALERSAAARGSLRTGNTLRDIVEYNQDFAAAEYNNVYSRALAAHQARSQGMRDAFAPRLAYWQMLSNAEMAAGLAEWQAQQNSRGGGGGGWDTDDYYDPEPTWPPSVYN